MKGFVGVDYARNIETKKSISMYVFTLFVGKPIRNFIDEDIQAQAQIPIEEPLQGLGGLMTRARAKKLEESLQQVVATIFEAAANKKDLEATIQNALLIEGQ